MAGASYADGTTGTSRACVAVGLHNRQLWGDAPWEIRGGLQWGANQAFDGAESIEAGAVGCPLWNDARIPLKSLQKLCGCAGAQLSNKCEWGESLAQTLVVVPR